MIIHDLKSAAAHTISVTSTATSLFSLLDTAGGADQELPGRLNGLDLYVTDDVMISWDPNVAPTATEGFLLKPGFYQFRNRPLAHMRLIRVGSSNVPCRVVVGSTDVYESESVALVDGDPGSSTTAVSDAYAPFESAAINATPTDYDVEAALGRASVDGSLINRGSVTLTVALDTTGGGFGTSFTVEAAEEISLTGISVYDLRVSAASGTGEFLAMFR